jgi:hypothetical protein
MLTFLDFATQADTTSESPTSGEGVPLNVIQYGLGGRPRRDSIGAGLETIRHTAGTSRNRVILSAP